MDDPVVLLAVAGYRFGEKLVDQLAVSIDGRPVADVATGDVTITSIIEREVPDHPLVARGSAEVPAIYLAVRNGCEARINRSTWLQLVDLADQDLCVSSQGARFALVPQ